jgi:transposase
VDRKYGMDGTQILTLGLGMEAAWVLKYQHLDTTVSPHSLDLHVEAERGSLYPCPECVKACPAHDLAEKTLTASELLPALGKRCTNPAAAA